MNSISKFDASVVVNRKIWFILKEYKAFSTEIPQGMKCMYNVTLGHLHVNTVAL